MKWITRERMGVDRCGCAWLIRTRIDPAAEFSFVPAGTDPASLDGYTFDMLGAEYGHEGERCSFETLLARHGLLDDPVLVEMGRIIRDADVPPARTRRLEAPGLDALLVGFAELIPDDHLKIEAIAPLYEALYHYCQRKLKEPRGSGATRHPRVRLSARVAAHLEQEKP
jgi:hypothetical protein